jgi:hypothetical protein
VGTAEAEVRWAHWVTPSLYVGERTAVASAAVSTATDALEVIRGGGTALLPEGAWDVAEETLRGLGLSEREIEAPLRADRPPAPGHRRRAGRGVSHKPSRTMPSPGSVAGTTTTTTSGGTCMSTTNSEVLAVTRAQSEYDDAKKSEGVLYALWFFLGAFGGHRFYVGDTGKGVGMLLTLGGIGIWTLIDVFFIGRRLKEVNRAKREAIFARHGLSAY